MHFAATMIATALTLASAYVLYTESQETRRVSEHVDRQQQVQRSLEAEIAALKAERAFLSRPTRIEPAARALGMRPATGQDFARLEELLPATPTAKIRP
jgi:cell division protein FtsL